MLETKRVSARQREIYTCPQYLPSAMSLIWGIEFRRFNSTKNVALANTSQYVVHPPSAIPSRLRDTVWREFAGTKVLKKKQSHLFLEFFLNFVTQKEEEYKMATPVKI